MPRVFRILTCFLMMAALAVAQEIAPQKNAVGANRDVQRQAQEFFETRVRPVLVEHCHACHGPKKQEAGLRLDSASGLRRGSESGPIVVPGAPDESLLVEVVQYRGVTKMPPKRKLPDEAIEALTTWVKLGAVWPAEVATPESAQATAILERGKHHWAFQPIREPAVPPTKNGDWVATPVDAFVLARLEAGRLHPSPKADRRTLIRRATFDLHGLPPTPDEVTAFEADKSPQAFENVIDRLLASPRYGERWGRHWLDVARYSDTKGYVRLKDNPLYPAAWTYRDYVVRAFNEDLPYDRFLLQQLAADQLDLGNDPRPLAAMGFLTLGQRFINSQNDIIDDRIDVVTRGLLGLTVSCARCHDHKFDPVPTRDYYALHGVFASSIEPHVPPMIVPAADLPRYETYRQELSRRTEFFDRFLSTQQAKLESSFRARAGEYLLAAQHEKVQANFLSTMFLIDASKDLNPAMTQRWGRLLEQTRHGREPVLAPWHALASLSAKLSTQGDFSTKARELIASWRDSAESSKSMNAVVLQTLTDTPPRDMTDVATRYGKLFQEAESRWRQSLKIDPTARQLTEPAWEEIRRLLYGPGAPPVVMPSDLEEFLFVDTTTQNRFHEQQRQVEDWIASPGAAPHAHILVDAAVPVNPHVFLRGNASNPGEAVPRQFLEVLTHGDRRPFQKGSGRLELAQAIVDPTNPMTARVFVNRVWMHHFGVGIVRTPSDFGLRGEPPTHPELLDYLARRFMADGWSIKKLHRLLMLSSVYQQQSQDNPLCREKDPENLLWWRMNRRRLDWESLRDALLAVSGQIDMTLGGTSVDLFTQPLSKRRTVYGFIDRQNLPSLLRTFDVASPDSSTPQRHETTVPQQAMFMMNSPFLKEQAQGLAGRPDLKPNSRTSERINAIHRLLFGRPASAEEIALGTKYLESSDPSAGPLPTGPSQMLTSWEEYAQALLLANEFMFVD
jgi:mono/diheme cytochrome c family protein